MILQLNFSNVNHLLLNVLKHKHVLLLIHRDQIPYDEQ